MKPRNAAHALMMAGAAIALCAIAAPAHAAGAAPAANATSVRTAIACPAKDLCLYRTNGTTVKVPSGQSRSFNPPLRVDLIENNTRSYYCAEVGLIIYLHVPPNEAVPGTRTVYGVIPGRVCPG